MSEEFKIRDCALITMSTGEQAQNLRELRDRLLVTHNGSIYYHFWGIMLRHTYVDPEYQNDFAVWAARFLHDYVIAERLSLIDPKTYSSMEDLRREIIEIIEQHLYEREHVPWARTGDQFQFLRTQIVVFDTGKRLSNPEEFTDIIPHLTAGSIFYHFIDSRRRTSESLNDFSIWLSGFGSEYLPLINKLNSIDPYFTTLTSLREEIAVEFLNFHGGG
jgi:hypothetical protein